MATKPAANQITSTDSLRVHTSDSLRVHTRKQNDEKFQNCEKGCLTFQ